jgi:hypothetical protein
MRVFSGLPPRKLCFRENALIPGAPDGMVTDTARCAPDRRRWREGRCPVRFVSGGFRRGVQRGNPAGLRDFEKVPNKLPAFYKPVKHFSGFLKNRLAGLVPSPGIIRRGGVAIIHNIHTRIFPAGAYRSYTEHTAYTPFQFTAFIRKSGLIPRGLPRLK